MQAELSRDDKMLADDMGRFFDDPLGFVLYAYDWANDKSIQVCKLASPWNLLYGEGYGPDAWACEYLHELGLKVRANDFDGHTPVPPIRMATASGHGIGKSALVAWLVDWIMSTRPGAQGTVTAVTAPQLRTKTWAQIAKWTKKCITSHWFEITTGMGTMRMARIGQGETWFCQAQTCAEENSEAFAGQHAPTSTSFYLFDEGSGVPDKIDEVSEGGLTDGEPMKFAFGNPTQNEGWFRECFFSHAHRWSKRQIDSRTVQITNKKMIEEWIEDHGIDSDFVKIRVRGMFPAMSAKQFFSITDLDAAFGKHLRLEQYMWAPKILVLDNSWEGDDIGVISLRQGLKFDVLRKFPKNNNDVEIANMLARLEDEHKADAVFVDGGYGTGVISVGRTLKRDWVIVWFGGAASADSGCLNKRAEMYVAANKWLREGGAIPPDHDMYNEAVSVQTVPRMDGVIQIEAKKDLKKRGQPSPNIIDTLVLSFAYPVHSKVASLEDLQRAQPGVLDARQREHDPFANMNSLQ
jgi:hypothetical protein